MKKLIVCISIFALLSISCNNSAENRRMAVTTNSEAAKKLYEEAMLAFENVYFAKFLKLATESLKEDPDFFMADYWLAIFALNFSTEKRFIEYGNKAVNCKAKLSDEELLLKDALKRLLENKKADVTDIGRKLIEDFPGDINSYGNLIWFQYLINDNEGMLKTLKSAIAIAERPAPYYNMLGYTYMNLNQNDSAALALDKYIELAPGIPNPYDSKGDYYMQIKDYNKAYETFMKAHEIDSLWGYKKAMKAKAIADSLAKI